jgi:hypothetical protein
MTDSWHTGGPIQGCGFQPGANTPSPSDARPMSQLAKPKPHEKEGEEAESMQGRAAGVERKVKVLGGMDK